MGSVKVLDRRSSCARSGQPASVRERREQKRKRRDKPRARDNRRQNQEQDVQPERLRCGVQNVREGGHQFLFAIFTMPARLIWESPGNAEIFSPDLAQT